MSSERASDFSPHKKRQRFLELLPDAWLQCRAAIDGLTMRLFDPVRHGKLYQKEKPPRQSV
jgi:hypothetical protein